MERMDPINYTLRLITSFFYRCILVSLSVWLIKTADNSYPVSAWYAVAFYAGIYIVIYRSGRLNKFPAVIRLTIDYALINYVLFGQNFNTLTTYTYALLPVLNSPNHTEKKRSGFIFTFVILTFAVHGQKDNYYDYALAITTIGLIFLSQYLRGFWLSEISRWFEVVNNFYGRDINVNETYRLYNELIESIKKSYFHKLFKLNSIYCFRYVDEGLILINSSELVLKAKIEDIRSFTKHLNEYEIVINYPIDIETKRHSNNVFLSIKDHDQRYVFLFLLDRRCAVSISYQVVMKTLKPVFERVARVLEVERHLQEQNESLLQKIKGKYAFVESARMAMHFLRNKFNPVSSYFQMQDAYDNLEDGYKKKELSKLLKDERENVNKSLELILHRITNILERSENPFIVGSLQEYPIILLLLKLRHLWFSALKEADIDSHIDPALLKEFVVYDDEHIDILLADIISNISKYNNGYYKLLIGAEEDNLIITFINNVKPKERSDFEKIVSEFTSQNSLEIFRRTTAGMYYIKSLLLQMNIDNNLVLQDNNIILTLGFKRVKK